MLDVLIKGGPVMIFIALCAVAATVIVIERLLYFRSVRKEYNSLVPSLTDLLKRGKFSEAAVLCENAASPLAKMVKAGLDFADRGEQSVRDAVSHASQREMPRLERYISALGTIANISTLLGLLGTVTGNIRAFGVLAASGAMGNPALLAGAIAEALITTAAGLIVSIPATIFYNFFVSRSNRIIVDTESSVGDMILLMVPPKGEESRAV
ncbi:MotA/TolQ/ExbB proton channel family protein [Breznakiella homolactica]|uniref:MotA/TolQ/ExbB proton channel family protein n=1 Tax=Breznakiella homolactica TaxID=2798577 RepID=A0A7T8BA03_9SPIR|nr:MotA/TolQ/ExbB proton channel family protein [Breznakiella homolactica]QQO09032.1 MotA/TolQ/ExbB proton channel family protein [Breznakiella homolactica]